MVTQRVEVVDMNDGVERESGIEVVWVGGCGERLLLPSLYWLAYKTIDLMRSGLRKNRIILRNISK